MFSNFLNWASHFSYTPIPLSTCGRTGSKAWIGTFWSLWRSYKTIVSIIKQTYWHSNEKYVLHLLHFPKVLVLLANSMEVALSDFLLFLFVYFQSFLLLALIRLQLFLRKESLVSLWSLLLSVIGKRSRCRTHVVDNLRLTEIRQ